MRCRKSRGTERVVVGGEEQFFIVLSTIKGKRVIIEL
jgi:hypothetical protein